MDLTSPIYGFGSRMDKNNWTTKPLRNALRDTAHSQTVELNRFAAAIRQLNKKCINLYFKKRIMVLKNQFIEAPLLCFKHLIMRN